MSKNFSGKFPDGTPTTCAKAYLGAWEQLSEPIEKEFGLQRVAFDPGLLFCDEVEPRLTVELPVWLAQRMVENIHALHRAEEALLELVALKDLKDECQRIRQRRPQSVTRVFPQDLLDAEADYLRRKDVAWAAARACLS